MTLAYPLTLPTAPGFVKTRFTAKSKVAVTMAEFTGAQNVYPHQGGHWEVELSLPPMTNAQARDWIGFLVALNGMEGTFYLGDPDYTKRGTGTGAPLVKGGSQIGKTLLTKGWTAGQTGIMKRGDYIQVGDTLHMITQDANTDDSGNATLDIWPLLRASPADNANVIISNPKGMFRLADNETRWEVDQMRIYGLSFAALEAY